MLTFTSLAKVCKEYLEGNLPDVKIEPGKRGEFPSITPCVWIYVEPSRPKNKNYKNYPVLRRAQVTFFACIGSAKDQTEAANKSMQLIEKVEQLLFAEGFQNFLNAHQENINDAITEITYTDAEQPMYFDGIYSDFATSALETWMNYAPFWEAQ